MIQSVLETLSEWWAVIIPVILFGIEMAGIGSALHAILRVRTSQAAVAWAVGLVAMPILVLPAYWIFGRKRFMGYREAIRGVEQQHKVSVAAVRRELLTDMNAGDPDADSSLAMLADVLDTPVSTGDQFQLLIDGEQFFAELLNQIKSAEQYVYAEFYIIRDDKVGNCFADALCERAAVGKTVRLLYDEVGSSKLSKKYLNKLRDAGVDVNAFNTRQGWTNRFQLNFRNHRKLLVVDGKRAITGGLNIGDEYLGHVSWASAWRDTGISVKGPVARKLQAVFAKDYYWAKRQDMPEANWSIDVNDEPTVEQHGDMTTAKGAAAVCATGPSDLRDRATMMFAAAANASKKRLWISTPYLVPDSTCINALSMARARGVDVRILVPSIPDQWLVYLAGFYYETTLESLGIPVYRYNEGFLHQKCVLVDDQLALIGSTNLDNRSLHLNFEMMLAADSPSLIRDVSKMLERDFANAKKKTSELDFRLPWYERIGTVLARLFSPVL